MRLKLLLSTALLCASASAFAQTWMMDSVAMGNGYANDVFYGLQLGTNSPKAGNEWDIAFQMTAFGDPSFNAAVRANHSKKAVEVYSLHYGSSKFGNLNPADTVGRTLSSTQLYNNDTSWGTGAFYQNHNLSDPFSYGWGNYDVTTHYLTGDSLYLVKVAGVPYQFWLEKYVSYPSDSIAYIFHVANGDNSNASVVKLYRKSATTGDFTNKLFAYYDLANRAVVNHEPVGRNTWDLEFTQYITMVMGPNGVQPYPVTGLLSNLSTKISHIQHLNPDDVNSTNYQTYITAPAYPMTVKIDAIGYDWKTYVNPGPNGYYKLDDSGSYIVRTTTTNPKQYWQFQFIRFDGSAGGGKIVFRKRYLADALAVPAIAAQSLNAFAVAPNPAGNETTLMLDAKKAANANVIITDMAGRVMMSAALDLKSGINAYSLNTASWPAGNYAVQVAAQDWKVSNRIAVVH